MFIPQHEFLLQVGVRFLDALVELTLRGFGTLLIVVLIIREAHLRLVCDHDGVGFQDFLLVCETIRLNHVDTVVLLLDVFMIAVCQYFIALIGVALILVIIVLLLVLLLVLFLVLIVLIVFLKLTGIY
jgi:hypothetical protein